MAWRLSDSTFYAYGDGLLTSYILRWNLHQLATDPLSLFHASFYYPAPYTLALSENMIGLSLLFWPIDFIFKDSLLLCNLIIIFSFFSLGLVAYVIFLHLTGSWWIGMIAGLAIGFAPARQAQFSHMQLLSYQPMLFSLFFAERWIRTFRRRDAAGFFGSLIAQFLFGVYLFVFNMVLITAFVPVLLLLRWQSVEWKKMFVQGAIGLVAMAAIIYPLYYPYQYVRDTLGIHISLDSLRQSGVNLTDFVITGAGFRSRYLVIQRFSNPYSPYPWEHAVGMPIALVVAGLLGLVSGVAGLMRRGRNWPAPHKAFFAASIPATLICVWLMFGPELHLVKESYPRVPMLYSFYYSVFPGFEALRVPARFVFPVTIGLTAIALIPAGWLRERMRRRWPVTTYVLLAALFIGIAVESHTGGLPLQTVRSKDNLPGFVTAIRKQPPAPVFIWPASLTGVCEYLNLYYNTYYWYPMINGRSGHIAPKQNELLNNLIASFPQPAAFDLLRAHKVRYLLIQGEWLTGPGEKASLNGQLNALSESGKLKKIYSDDVDSLWEILY